MKLDRRTFLTLTAFAGTATALGALRALATTDGGTDTTIKKLELTEAQWRERLTPERYKVLRQEGTERAFSSPLDKEYGEGNYHCAGCDLILFTSATKFDSRTGWPSFYAPYKQAHIGTKTDYLLVWPRTEYHCARCGGHQGHVFDDGPPPTGLRYCNNGLALKFKAGTPAS